MTDEELTKHFDGIDRRFEKVDDRFEKVDERFEKVDQRFDAIDRRFDILEDFVKDAAAATRTFVTDEGTATRAFVAEQALATQKQFETAITAEGVRTRRYFDIVAENLRGDIQKIADGHLALRSTDATL